MPATIRDGFFNDRSLGFIPYRTIVHHRKVVGSQFSLCATVIMHARFEKQRKHMIAIYVATFLKVTLNSHVTTLAYKTTNPHLEPYTLSTCGRFSYRGNR